MGDSNMRVYSTPYCEFYEISHILANLPTFYLTEYVLCGSIVIRDRQV